MFFTSKSFLAEFYILFQRDLKDEPELKLSSPVFPLHLLKSQQEYGNTVWKHRSHMHTFDSKDMLWTL